MTTEKYLSQELKTERPLPRFIAYLKLAMAVLAVLWFIGMTFFVAYLLMTSISIGDVPTWIIYLLGGGFFVLGFTSTIINAVGNQWQYGHLKLDNTLILMAWMMVFGVYSGIQLVGDENRLGDNDRVLIMHGVNSLASRAAANDDGEQLAFWCQERVRYEQQFKGWLLPDMPEACKH